MSAISAVRKKEVDLKKAVKLHNALRLNLQRSVKDISLKPKETLATLLGHKTDFPRETEDRSFN
jgi:hypothetical protein